MTDATTETRERLILVDLARVVGLLHEIVRALPAEVELDEWTQSNLSTVADSLQDAAEGFAYTAAVKS